MTEFVNPKDNAKPLGAYSHSVRVPPNAEWLVISGQVGVDSKGKLQPTVRKQAEQAFRNVLNCLKAIGLAKMHLVYFTVFLIFLIFFFLIVFLWLFPLFLNAFVMSNCPPKKYKYPISYSVLPYQGPQ